MKDLVQQLLASIQTHQNLAIAIMFVTAFAESFVFVSLLFPGTALLIAAGTLTRDGYLPYLPIIAGAIVGAVLGDTVSYVIGRRSGRGISRLWPFVNNPRLLQNGIWFFERHGGKSVFIGRFFGPMRAVIPLAAGIMGMPRDRFWFANIASALIWAPMLLLVGDAIGNAGDRLIGTANTIVLVLGALTLTGIAGIVWAMLRANRSKG